MEMARQLANVAGEPWRHKPGLIAKIERSEAICRLLSREFSFCGHHFAFCLVHSSLCVSPCLLGEQFTLSQLFL
jgi:hypothetical protein